MNRNNNKKLTMPSADKVAEQLHLSFCDDVNVKWYSHSGKLFDSFLYN